VHTKPKQAETNRYFYTETGYVPPQDIYPRSAKNIQNVYLFELNVPSLQIQRNNRELETIIQECVLITIRDSIPTEEIIRAYLDESIEQEEEVTIENIPDEDEKPDKSGKPPRPNG
jgi:hypothetical protein